MLTGPSYSGKSKLITEFEELCNRPFKNDLLRKRPAVSVSVGNKSHAGAFATKDFTLDMLEKLGHPGFVLDSQNLATNLETIQRRSSHTNSMLSQVMQNTLEVLKVEFLIIDEAQLLELIQGGPDAAAKVLINLKDICSDANCILILTGAYPILDMLLPIPHLLSREFLVDIRRYRSSDDLDLLEFEKLLEWYSSGLVFENQVTSLREWNQFLYQVSYGVIGNLSHLIRGALANMQAVGDVALDVRHFEASLRPAAHFKSMQYEIDTGEAFIDGLYTAVDANTIHRSSSNPANDRFLRPFQPKTKRYLKGSRV